MSGILFKIIIIQFLKLITASLLPLTTYRYSGNYETKYRLVLYYSFLHTQYRRCIPSFYRNETILILGHDSSFQLHIFNQ